MRWSWPLLNNRRQGFYFPVKHEGRSHGQGAIIILVTLAAMKTFGEEVQRRSLNNFIETVQ
jgi:hypothetical protein